MALKMSNKTKRRKAQVAEMNFRQSIRESYRLEADRDYASTVDGCSYTPSLDHDVTQMVHYTFEYRGFRFSIYEDYLAALLKQKPENQTAQAYLHSLVDQKWPRISLFGVNKPNHVYYL